MQTVPDASFSSESQEATHLIFSEKSKPGLFFP